MSDTSSRFDPDERDSGSGPASGELALTGRELKTFLALTEDRPLESEQLAVAEQLRRDPNVRRALERQRHVAGLLRGGGPALPPALAARLGTQTHDSRSRTLVPSDWSVKLIGATAAALATVVLVATAIISWSIAGPSAWPTAAQVAALWTLPATRRVEADPADRTRLDISYHGIAYPNYHDREGWHPVAARYDRIGGLATVTVFYQTGRRCAAYTVVPTTGLAVPAEATRLRVAGLSLTEFRSGDRWIVTFRRSGNTCVLTAAAPRERRWLIALATWHGGPAVT